MGFATVYFRIEEELLLIPREEEKSCQEQVLPVRDFVRESYDLGNLEGA